MRSRFTISMGVHKIISALADLRVQYPGMAFLMNSGLSPMVEMDLKLRSTHKIQILFIHKASMAAWFDMIK